MAVNVKMRIELGDLVHSFDHQHQDHSSSSSPSPFSDLPRSQPVASPPEPLKVFAKCLRGSGGSLAASRAGTCSQSFSFSGGTEIRRFGSKMCYTDLQCAVSTGRILWGKFSPETVEPKKKRSLTNSCANGFKKKDMEQCVISIHASGRYLKSIAHPAVGAVSLQLCPHAAGGADI